MIIVCSDIHGRISSIDLLEEKIKKYRPTKIICLGDFLYNGPRNGVPKDYDPAYVYKKLNLYADLIIGIRGNCDALIDESLLRFKLKDKVKIKIGGVSYLLIHGHKLNSMTLDELRRKEVLCFGHTHIYKLELKNNILYFNPGSISFPKNENPRSYAIIDDGVIKILDLVTDKTIQEINTRNIF